MKNYVILICCFISFQSFAQNGFYVDNNYVTENWVNVDLSNNFEYFNLDAFVGNNSENTIEYGWIRSVNEDCPMNWNILISDKYFDYTPDVSESPVPVDLAPNESDAIFRVHVQPQGVPGCCEVEIIFTENANPSSPLDTTYFLFQINQEDCMITAVEETIIEPFTMYPNPAETNLYIKNAENFKKVTIINLAGKVCIEESFNPQQSIDISALPKGVYSVVFVSNNGQQSVKKLLKS